jgi:hypothetical protein
VHIGAIAGHKIEQPGSEIVRAEQIDLPLRLIHFVFKIDAVHRIPSVRMIPALYLMSLIIGKSAAKPP